MTDSLWNHKLRPTSVSVLIPGKVWKPKEEEKVQINEDDKVETEWDEVLAQATEEELVDLAGLCSADASCCIYAFNSLTPVVVH